MARTSSGKDNTVFWWIGWITLTILSFFISCYFWTGFIARHVGPMDQKGVPMIWVAAVFGSWMVLLVPLIIVMYNKVDRAYEDARLGREAAEVERSKKEYGVRSVLIPEADRMLPKRASDKLKRTPRTIHRGHLVTVVLNDGRRVPNVFILDRREVLGVYDALSLPFKTAEIADLEPADLDHLPVFEPSRWLRLDGAGLPVVR